MKKQKLLKVLNKTQINSLIKNEELKQFDKAVFLLYFSTGCRVSELLALNYNDVLDKKGNIKNKLAIIGKGKKYREVPLNTLAKNSIKIILKNTSEKVIVNKNTPLLVSNKKSRYTRQAIYNLIKKIQKVLDIENISPHTLRHSLATYLLKTGSDIKVIQDILGHSSISTTIDIYCHNTIEELQTESGKLDSEFSFEVA